MEKEAEVEEDINEVKKKREMRKCTYCKKQGHIAKDCYKRKADTNSGSSGNAGGKGKGQTNGNSRSTINSHTFTDQERAHFLTQIGPSQCLEALKELTMPQLTL